MLTPEEEAHVLSKAYVPEHIVNLMVPISKGEPILKEDHLGFVKDNWLIFVGYPLNGSFSLERCERILKQAVETFRPEYLWFIGPEIPASLLDACKERETDQYYRLDLDQTKLKPSLQRMAEKAFKEMTVERGHSISKEHEALIDELLLIHCRLPSSLMVAGSPAWRAVLLHLLTHITYTLSLFKKHRKT